MSAKRVGNFQIDHGDTSCKTRDAADYIEKTWAYAKSKGFESPAAQERAREFPAAALLILSVWSAVRGTGPDLGATLRKPSD